MKKIIIISIYQRVAHAPGVKVERQCYCHELFTQLPHGDHVLRQHGARSHTTRFSLKYPNEHCPELVNPCDYAIWVIVEEKVRTYRRNTIATLEILKERMIEEWEATSTGPLMHSVGEFARRRAYRKIQVER